jgi:hypothetical protein
MTCDDYEEADETSEHEPIGGDEFVCLRCGGEGKIPTREYESYFGAMYKPCPECIADKCIGEPGLS